MSGSTVETVRVRPWDIELTEPFGIAGGAQYVARNVLVEVTLSDGTTGTGEAAPFPAVSGETQEAALSAVERASPLLVGLDAARWRRTGALLREAIGETPSALAALETAVLDAHLRRSRLSLWEFFGGAEPSLETDVTIVTGTAARAGAAARDARAGGFRTLKVKVGGASLDHDVERLDAVLAAAPHARLVLDANASMTPDEAVELVARVGRKRIALFEQPTAPMDLDALRAVRERAGVAVAADESARRASDVQALATARAADVVNVKISKCGLSEACDTCAAARAAGLGLMIGGMVETPLAMTVSACLAAGLGGFDFIDLDTPFFMKRLPTRGGWGGGRRAGEDAPRKPIIDLAGISAGHGVEVLPAAAP